MSDTTVKLIDEPTGGRDIRTPWQILDDWRNLIKSERFSEQSCLKHRMSDLSKWHEGRADALERCADELEFLIIPKLDDHG